MNTEELHRFAREVAEALDWRYDLVDSLDTRDGRLNACAYVRPGLTSFGVSLRVDYKRPKHVTASGCIPTRDKGGDYHWTWSGKTPTIHVLQSKGASAVASEIKRRLLPRYLPIYESARGVLTRQNAHIEERIASLELLSDFGHASKNGRHDRDVLYLNRGGTVTFRGDGQVELRISVASEQAFEILQFLRDDVHAR